MYIMSIVGGLLCGIVLYTSYIGVKHINDIYKGIILEKIKYYLYKKTLSSFWDTIELPYNSIIWLSSIQS